MGRLVDGIEDFDYGQMVSGTCDASIEAGDELGTTRMSEFRVVFRVAGGVLDAATREVSLRAMKCGRKEGKVGVKLRFVWSQTLGI